MRKVSMILLFLLGLILILFFFRLFNPVELDDLHPNIVCDTNLIKNSGILWIIPLYDNKSMSNNSEWIRYILSLNKTIGLHGVYHTYNEFDYTRDDHYLETGINEFERSFGYKPRIFKAPQLAFNESNRELIENHGMIIKGKWNQLFRKVYHCSDTGLFPNWFIRLY